MGKLMELMELKLMEYVRTMAAEKVCSTVGL